MSLESLDHVVAGVLFDFGGFLTTRDKRLSCSSVDDAVPMVEALTEFMKLRGVDMDCSPMLYDWPPRLSAGKCVNEPATGMTCGEQRDIVVSLNMGLDTCTMEFIQQIEKRLDEALSGVGFARSTSMKSGAKVEFVYWQFGQCLGPQG